MKNLKLFKTLLVLLGVLITSVTVPTWASGGNEGTSITVYATGHINWASSTWDNSISTLKIDVRRKGDDFSSENAILDAAMTNTGYTYNGYVIYSYTFKELYDGAQVRVKHYQSGTWQEDFTADWGGTSAINGKIYDGYYSSAHQWLTFGRDITVYAVPESMDGSKWTEGNTLKAVFKYGDQDSEKTDKLTFSKTDETYKGNYIYKSPSVLIPYNVIKKISFYYNDGSDKELYDLTPGSQYGTDDIDGKIFLGYNSGHIWVSYGRDVTVYTIPDYLFANYGTPYSEDSHYPAVCIQMENGSTWDTENMTKTSYTYATYPIYKATILIKNNKLWEYQIKYFKKSDDTQVSLYQFNNTEPKTEYAPTYIDDKIYRGYIDDSHVFTPYSYDLALNQQGGSSGSSSVIVAEGSAMPAATMPTKTGYTFGGYYDAVGGGGTQYYAANGSSATNWDNRTTTTLYAKWTANNYTVTLHNQDATTAGAASVTVTYDATVGNIADNLPAKTGYTFGGYYKDEDCLTRWVIKTDGYFNWDCDSINTSTGAWEYTGDVDLYAKWTEDTHTVTVAKNDNAGGTISTTSVSGVGIATASSTITATPYFGYRFTGWTIPSGVTIKTGSSTSNSITINATADSKTITANFVREYMYIEGAMTIYNESRGSSTSVTWSDENSTAIQMTYDAENHRFYLHTYNTVSNLKGNGDENYFYFKASTSSSALSDVVNVGAYANSATYKDLTAASLGKQGGRDQNNTYHLNPTTPEDAYAILYLYESGGNIYLKYELECALSYYGNGSDGGSAPADRTYYPFGEDQTAAVNTFTKTGYTFSNWKTEADEEYDEGDTDVDMNAHEVCLNAQWAANDYTVTLNNNSATTAGASSVAVTYDAAVGNIASNLPAKTGYVFDGYYDNEECTGSWIISKTGYFVWGNSYVDASGNWIGTSDVALYAKWVVRYALYGSVEGSDVAGYGMPGWAEATDFTYDAVNSEYTLDLSLTKPNTTYKFRIVDHTDNKSWGLASKAVVPEKTATKLNSTAADAQLATAGTGTYSLTVTEVDAPTTHPQVYIVNPASYQVNYGKSLSAGGTITVVDDASNAIPSGGYVREGGSVTYTAAANTGYTFEGWYTDDTYEERFSTDASWTHSEIEATSNSYAKFVPATLTFTGSTDWDWFDASNWSPACVPTIDHDVILQANTRLYGVEVKGKGNHAKAKSIKIDKSTDERKNIRFEIWSYCSLIVAEDIQAKHVGDADYGAVNAEDLRIETSHFQNGGLICGGASSNTSATYEFHSKSFKSGKWYINQYVGIPFTSMKANQLYDFNIFIYADTVDDWRSPASDTMEPWVGYDLIRQHSGDVSDHDLNGTLILPGTGVGKTKNLSCTRRNPSDAKWNEETNPFPASIDGKSGHQDHMFANSWTAPIEIAAMETSNFTHLVHTIYIFNAGYEDGSSREIGDEAGQWSTFPLESVKAGIVANAVIPAMQAFLVTDTASGSSITLDYEKHVYDPAVAADSIRTFPTRAPRRVKKSSSLNSLTMLVRSEEDVIADRLYIIEGNNLRTDTFDNGWDGNKIMGESFAPQLYAMSDGSKMAVNAVKDMEGMKIGFKAGTSAQNYTFSFDYEEQAEPLYLYDKETNAYTEITNEATYEFTTSDRKAHERFLLTRSNAPQIATGVEEIDTENVQRAQKFMQDQQIFIRRGERVYNVTGSLVK